MNTSIISKVVILKIFLNLLLNFRTFKIVGLHFISNG